MQPSVFQKLLLSAIQQNASDIHLQVAHPPLLRVNGELLEVKYHPLTPPETQAVAEEILSASYHAVDLATLREIDVSYSLEGHARFRVNIFRQRGSLGIVLRIIPIAIRSFARAQPAPGAGADRQRSAEAWCCCRGHRQRQVHHARLDGRLHQPAAAAPTSSPSRIRSSSSTDARSTVISQREVGTDTASFADRPLRAALRQDPDVILVGEMRDQADRRRRPEGG